MRTSGCTASSACTVVCSTASVQSGWYWYRRLSRLRYGDGGWVESFSSGTRFAHGAAPEMLVVPTGTAGPRVCRNSPSNWVIALTETYLVWMTAALFGSMLRMSGCTPTSASAWLEQSTSACSSSRSRSLAAARTP